MKKSGIVKLLSWLSNIYPGKFDYPTGNDLDDELMENNWHEWLADFPEPVVEAAAKKAVMKNEVWPPTVVQVVKEVRELQKTEDEKLAWEEAFHLTIELIKKYGSVYGRDKINAELPARAKKAAEIMGGLSYMGYHIKDENKDFHMKRYKEIYENLEEREEEKLQLPPSHRKEIDQIAQKFKGTRQIQIEGESNEE